VGVGWCLSWEMEGVENGKITLDCDCLDEEKKR